MALPLWAKILGANAFFLLLHPAIGDLLLALPPILQSLAVNAALLLVPAMGWDTGRTTRTLGMRLLSTVTLSTGAFFGSLVVIRLAGVALTPAVLWNGLWLVANAGFGYAALARRKAMRRQALSTRELALGGLLFIGAYSLYFWGATRVVPPQEDHDLEVLATGYGLLTRFEPLLITDRGGVYFFAHPPLLHFYVAGSFVLHGAVGELEFYDDVSRGVRQAREGGGTPAANPADDAELSKIYARYHEHPSRQAARASNLFFASATVALLGLWVARFSRRAWGGALTAIAYATSPEVFVRSSYGGYFAIGGFACLLMLIAAERWRRWPDWRQGALPGVIGGFAALADHKLIVLPAALLLHAAVTRLRTGRRRVSALVNPAVAGFAAGILIFWSWGLAIAPAAFIQDHMRDHLLQRITHENPLGYGGYATPLGLWIEFLRHTGYLLVPTGLLLICRDQWLARGSSMNRLLPARGLWLWWIGIASVAFTVIDWRMTKHIIPLLLPLTLALVPDRDAPRWRVVGPAAVLVITLAFSIVALGGLAADFQRFTITPAW